MRAPAAAPSVGGAGGLRRLVLSALAAAALSAEQCGGDVVDSDPYALDRLPIIQGWSRVINCSSPNVVHDVAVKNNNGMRITVLSNFGGGCAVDEIETPLASLRGLRGYIASDSSAPWVNFSAVPCGSTSPCCVIIYCGNSNAENCDVNYFGRFYAAPAPSTSPAVLAGLIAGIVVAVVVIPAVCGFCVWRNQARPSPAAHGPAGAAAAVVVVGSNPVPFLQKATSKWG